MILCAAKFEISNIFQNWPTFHNVISYFVLKAYTGRYLKIYYFLYNNKSHLTVFIFMMSMKQSVFVQSLLVILAVVYI